MNVAYTYLISVFKKNSWSKKARKALKYPLSLTKTLHRIFNDLNLLKDWNLML